MPKQTILLVDDDKMLCEVLADFLADQDWEVLCAFNGLEAIQLYEAHCNTIGLVLTDWRMPKLDGGRLTEWLREQTPSLPIVVMTGSPKEEYEPVFNTIADIDVIEKPFDFKEVVKVVAQHIAA
jgi:DNA-binding response OmpR family regulator